MSTKRNEWLPLFELTKEYNFVYLVLVGVRTNILRVANGFKAYIGVTWRKLRNEKYLVRLQKEKF